MNTRIAPSPTGDMHLGTARTAYFNWLAARASGGQFILRIDDTDLNRSKPEYTQVILDTMNWLGLDYDHIVYQSQRFDVYLKQAEMLIAQGWAKKEDGAIVLSIQGTYPAWKDELAGQISITDNDVDTANGMVLIKSDGSPSYNFASVVDDVAGDIDLIIRGVDHITNTSRQVIIFNLLTSSLPKFCHIGLIYKDGKKLSKRDGAASMLHYRDAGYDPDAMLNCMARLGWGPKVDDKTTALLPRERMLELFFNGGRMRNSPANLDIEKLNSFDRKYKARKKV
jgi:glutamyl-tRNA synthetase